MNPAGSVTKWIHQLSQRDQAAIQKIWEAYFPRLVGLARKRLWGTPTQAADAEDVALSAFDSFCRRAAQGRFPQVVRPRRSLATTARHHRPQGVQPDQA